MWEGESTTDPAHESAAGTLKLDVSGLKRRSKRHIRLSPELPENATEQRRLLRWLVQREEEILESGTPVERQTLERRGVRTNPKAYFDTDAPTNAQRAAHSRALRTLAERGLILLPSPRERGRRGPPAVYVRLTPAGRTEAKRRTPTERMELLERRFADDIKAGLVPDFRIVSAPGALPLEKGLQDLERDVRRLLGLIRKYAPQSPLVDELRRAQHLIEEAESIGPLTALVSPEDAEEVARGLQQRLGRLQVALQRIRDELRRVLGDSNL